jgi:hypothetical protein
MMTQPKSKIVLPSIVALIAVLGLAASIAYAFPSNPASFQSLGQYTVNGLTCSLTGSVFAGPQNITEEISVIQQVVQTPQFLSATKGVPYVLADAGIAISGLETINSTTFQPPNYLELGFATYGANTQCFTSGKFLNWIDVQIPVLNGTISIANESVHVVGGPK